MNKIEIGMGIATFASIVYLAVECESQRFGVTQPPTSSITPESIVSRGATLEAYPTLEIRNPMRAQCKDVGINGYLTGQNKCVTGAKHQ